MLSASPSLPIYAPAPKNHLQSHEQALFSLISMPLLRLPQWLGLLRIAETSCNAGDAADVGSIPGPGRSPGGENGSPLQYSCLENPRGQKSLAGYKELATIKAPERAHAHTLYLCSGQFLCLESPYSPESTRLISVCQLRPHCPAGGPAPPSRTIQRLVLWQSSSQHLQP